MAGKIDWDEAFAYYASLGRPRTFAAVATRFGVSDTAVRKRAAAEKWHGRAADLDRQAAEKAERLVVRDRAARIADTIKIVDAARMHFARQLSDPEFVITAAGFSDLVKLEQLLEGGPTERHAVGVDGLLSRLRVAVNAGELERAIGAGDLQAAQRAMEGLKR